jgi:hypothetical protein
MCFVPFLIVKGDCRRQGSRGTQKCGDLDATRFRRRTGKMRRSNAFLRNGHATAAANP